MATAGKESTAEGEAIVKIAGTLFGEISTLRTTLEDITSHLSPEKQDIQTKRFEGQNDRVTTFLSHVPTRAMEKLVSNILTNMTPKFSDWNRYAHEKAELNNIDSVQQWMSKFSEVVRDELIQSNFYVVWPQVIKDMIIGTGCMIVDEGKKNLLNFSHPPLGWFSFVEDGERTAMELYYKYTMTLQQAWYEFGEELPKKIMDKLTSQGKTKPGQNHSSKSFTEEVHFIRCIRPRNPGEFNFKDFPMEAIENMPWKSTWVEEGSRKIVRKAGFSSKVFAIERWDDGVQGAKVERFGWGPARKYISKFKLIHTAEQDQVTLIQKAAHPAWLASSDSFVNDPDFMPEGINYINTDSSNSNWFKPEPVANLTNPVVMETYLERLAQDIKEIFYNDIFEPIGTLPDKQRTAFEIDTRMREATASFADANHRIELLLSEIMVRAGIIVYNRSLNVDFKDGRIPPPPEEMFENGEITFVPKFNSRITQRLKSLQNQNLTFALQRQGLLIEATQGSPVDVLRNLDKDKAFREGLINDGVDADWLISEEDVQATDEAASQAQAIQEGVETAKTASEAVGNLPEEQQIKLLEAVG